LRERRLASADIPRCYVGGVAEEPIEYRSCDVCGRTMLRGERIRAYVTPQGDAVSVCTLCSGRAEAAGWVPEELAEAQVPSPGVRRRPQLALRARLGRVADRARAAGASRRGGEEEPEPEVRPAPSPTEKAPPANPKPEKPAP